MRLLDDEKKEILETFKWIKVERYIPSAPEEYLDYKFEYDELLKHHKEETEFLIQKVRDLVLLIDQMDQDRRDAQVFYEDELSEEFKKSIRGEVTPISPEKLKQMREAYEQVMSKAGPGIR